jgi:hypothetical protein
MRPVPVPTAEELGEDGWIIAAAGIVINPVSFKQVNQIAEKRLNNGTAEKAWESSWAKTESFEASKIR